jgi:predicted SnoaL-like aldol condensation-catalyzing enzyme
LQCNHWDQADKWLTARYIQHNPNVALGRDGVVKFFGTRPRTPTCDKLTTKIVAVLADGDFVTVVIPRELKDPKDPSTTYSPKSTLTARSTSLLCGLVGSPPPPNGRE